MNINDLEGRELNKKMAELMGWKIAHDPLEDRKFYYPIGTDPEWCDFDYYVDEWQPSTDIAAAMLVEEKMRQDDFWWKAAYKETLVEGIYQAGYSVTFRCVRAGTRGYHTATALMLPEAICKAALMAAEAE